MPFGKINISQEPLNSVMGGSSADRPERRYVKREQEGKQRMYDDYTKRSSAYAQKTGRREPYHLTYMKKIKEQENESNRRSESNRKA